MKFLKNGWRLNEILRLTTKGRVTIPTFCGFWEEGCINFLLVLEGLNKMKLARFTTRGRITIPIELRKMYKLKPGTKINFVEERDGIKIILKDKAITKETIDTKKGFLGTKGKLLKSLMEAKK